LAFVKKRFVPKRPVTRTPSKTIPLLRSASLRASLRRKEGFLSFATHHLRDSVHAKSRARYLDVVGYFHSSSFGFTSGQALPGTGSSVFEHHRLP
jgi:hypothetical protein